jgi:hypothetical protein
MKATRFIPVLLLALFLGSSVTVEAQGRGKGQGAAKSSPGQGKGASKQAKGAPSQSSKGKGAVTAAQKANDKARGPDKLATKGAGNGRALGVAKGSGGRPMLPVSANASPRAGAANRGRAVSRFARDLRLNEVRPVVRNFIVSTRPAQFMTGGAVAYALARGIPDNALVVVPTDREVALRNRRGDVLVLLDDNRARTLGAWQVAPLDDRVNSGAPSFCRSGAGHPVWGRQWCLDKGFGLGAERDIRWGTTRDVTDVILGRRITTGNLTRDALLSILGPVVFDRLALHAVTLGYTDPLTGIWHSEATGPDVLLVNAGTIPIAELVDTNRDQRADVMLVALRPW